MPSVGKLDELMLTWSRDWTASNGSPTNYFEVLRSAIERYYCTGTLSLQHPLNYGKVLGEMIALSHWMTPAPWGNTMRETACPGDAPASLVFPYPILLGS